jgi:hypothetical protein
VWDKSKAKMVAIKLPLGVETEALVKPVPGGPEKGAGVGLGVGLGVGVGKGVGVGVGVGIRVGYGAKAVIVTEVLFWVPAVVATKPPIIKRVPKIMGTTKIGLRLKTRGINFILT